VSPVTTDLPIANSRVVDTAPTGAGGETTSPDTPRPSPRTTELFRPGRRGVQVAIALALTGLGAFAWGPWLIVVLLAAVFTTYLAWLDLRAARSLLDDMAVARRLPKIVGRDLHFDVEVELTNRGQAPVSGTFRDVFPDEARPRLWREDFDLPSGAVETLRVDCRIPIRGLHPFGPIWMRAVGPAGLVEVQREFVCPGEIKVLPETFASREELQKDTGAQLLLLDKVLRSRQLGFGTEFASLDNYREGDDPRCLDWKATARHRTPVVRRFQVERHRDVLILLDCGRLMGALTDRGTKLDRAVDSALNLCSVVLRSGDRCGIGVFDSELRGFLAPLAGPRALSSLVECVYDLKTRWHETDFVRMYAEVQRRQSKRSLIVILSDLGDAEASRSQCAALARLNKRHLVLFAALRTPVVRQVIHEPTSSVDHGARQAVALGLLADRDRALHELSHGGVHVLDVEPRQLTLPLVNRFIELRQRNQL
jgi:uncharacterized protein (DUF58 family)